MWAVSFTFKYLPNIIQKFCMHVAVGDACALSASVAHVSNLLCRHHHALSVCVCVIGSQVHGVRSQRDRTAHDVVIVFLCLWN